MGATMSIPNLEQPDRDGAASVDRTPFRIANGGTRCTRCRLPKHAPNVSSSAKDFERSSRNGTRPFGTRAK